MYVIEGAVVFVIIFGLGFAAGWILSGHRNRQLKQINRHLDELLDRHDVAITQIIRRAHEEITATGDPFAMHIIDIAAQADKEPS